MTLAGMGPALAAVGSTTKMVFKAYVERVLVPGLRSGQIVVLDNLAAHEVHESERVTELVQEQGCKLLYLPPYSPDFNPIEEVEEAFSKVKGISRKAGARKHEALIEASGVAISAITPADARGYFEHGSYYPTVYSL